MQKFLIAGSRGYLLRFAKSAVKVAIGRKPLFYAQDRFFLAYLRQLLGLSRARITCRLEDCPTEGGGSQAITMMIVLDLARTLDLDYVHTPFIDIRHADRSREAWIAAWESLFNFGAGEVGVGEVGADQVDRGVVAITARNLDSIRSLFRDLSPRDEQDTHVIPQFSPAIVGEFRRKYHSTKRPRRNARLTVCVHVRRLNRFDDNVDYVASLSRVERTLATVRGILNERGVDPVVRIFSQGDVSEFPETLRSGAELHLDADPIWSLEQLVEADVLISSRGSFSYVAGLLCEGIVICEPFYPPQRDWLVCDDDGGFDVEAFAQRLA
ncbi:MAG: hypothetical protein JWQ58_3468 [Reyranella sp.]|nr:hypothetical protein [Reyranella sp.]